jgi:hypothetical protein
LGKSIFTLDGAGDSDERLDEEELEEAEWEGGKKGMVDVFESLGIDVRTPEAGESDDEEEGEVRQRHLDLD